MWRCCDASIISGFGKRGDDVVIAGEGRVMICKWLEPKEWLISCYRKWLDLFFILRGGGKVDFWDYGEFYFRYFRGCVCGESVDGLVDM
jgi:hypothetical protein